MFVFSYKQNAFSKAFFQLENPTEIKASSFFVLNFKRDSLSASLFYRILQKLTSRKIVLNPSIGRQPRLNEKSFLPVLIPIEGRSEELVELEVDSLGVEDADPILSSVFVSNCASLNTNLSIVDSKIKLLLQNCM